jgi:ferredoxin
MTQHPLKKIRVGVSLLFFFLTVALFLDINGVAPATVYRATFYLQFTPSLIQFTQLISWAAAGFIGVLLLTLLYGRVFCSTVCPFGTLQDILTRLAEKLRKRRRRVRFRYSRPHNFLRHTLLLLTAVSLLSGSLLGVELLDPFSNFGRIVVGLVRPLFIALHNLTVHVLEGWDLYLLYPLEWKLGHWLVLGFPLLMLGLIGVMAARKGRLFCNTLCPVGTLLGLVSRFALFRIEIDKARCSLCAQCSMECKAGCIHLKRQEVDFTRCVGCFNCLAACPELGIRFRHTLPRNPVVQPIVIDPTRRRMLSQGAAWLIGLSSMASLSNAPEPPTNRLPTLIPNRKTHSVAPPGAVSIERFSRACTACHLCISACPTHVLQPSLLEYGLQGVLQPYLNYAVSYCNYECVRCSEICPTRAIRPLNVEQKRLIQIGKVQFIEENCVVVTDKTACGACAEHCPTKAVRMVPYKEELTLPELDTKVCVGCGACEYACPVRPHKAIFVDGEPVHLAAQPPRSERLEVDITEDFPF